LLFCFLLTRLIGIQNRKISARKDDGSNFCMMNGVGVSDPFQNFTADEWSRLRAVDEKILHRSTSL
jgi:hypothetical protein